MKKKAWRNGLFSPENIKTAAFLFYSVIFLFNAFGFYPRINAGAPLHILLFTLAGLALYFISAAGSAKNESRFFYITLLVCLIAANITGGPASPFKYSLLALVLYSAAAGKTRRAAGAALFFVAGMASEIRNFSGYEAGLLPASFVTAVVMRFTGGKNKSSTPAETAAHESGKGVEDFKESAYSLLDNLMNAYLSLLKPVSILLFLKPPSGGAKYSIMAAASRHKELIDNDYELDSSDGIIGAALKKNDFFMLDTGAVKMPYYKKSPEIKSAAVFPVVMNSLLGFIVADFDTGTEENNREQLKESLQKLAEEVLNMLELLDISKKAVINEQRVSRLYEINEKLNLLEGKSRMLEVFFNELRAFDIVSGYYAGYDPGNGSFCVSEVFNYPGNAKGAVFSADDDEIVRYLIRESGAAVIENTQEKNIRLNLNLRGAGSFLIALLKSGNTTHGFIKLDKAGGAKFTDFEVKTIKMIFSRLVMLMENAELYERIKRQATEDGLTGIYNHLTFQEMLGTAIDKNDRRLCGPVSLALMDIDFFKKFNDEFGHQEGDNVLKRVALMLTDFTAKYENTFAARYGGEEFVFVMEGY
ncbi:MAG TPA: sensor domain-containing diguanylate cyclase, partial [Firmicutes bacterium]|nr:sensor domain-containing diguanylate cyclase [Bacillota bacterium]